MGAKPSFRPVDPPSCSKPRESWPIGSQSPNRNSKVRLPHNNKEFAPSVNNRDQDQGVRGEVKCSSPVAATVAWLVRHWRVQMGRTLVVVVAVKHFGISCTPTISVACGTPYSASRNQPRHLLTSESSFAATTMSLRLAATTLRGLDAISLEVSGNSGSGFPRVVSLPFAPFRLCPSPS